MTDKQTQALYEDLAKVCFKHGLRGIVGMWYEQAPGNDTAVMEVYDIADTQMKNISQATASILNDIHNKITGQDPDITRGIHFTEGGKKN